MLFLPDESAQKAVMLFSSSQVHISFFPCNRLFFLEKNPVNVHPGSSFLLLFSFTSEATYSSSKFKQIWENVKILQFHRFTSSGNNNIIPEVFLRVKECSRYIVQFVQKVQFSCQCRQGPHGAKLSFPRYRQSDSEWGVYLWKNKSTACVRDRRLQQLPIRNWACLTGQLGMSGTKLARNKSNECFLSRVEASRALFITGVPDDRWLAMLSACLNEQRLCVHTQSLGRRKHLSSVWVLVSSLFFSGYLVLENPVCTVVPGSVP